ncbi:MAG TPA: PD-(D/E)XK nuclease family protein [Kiritimatiellia bacterium]|nr:PD-(D/E)XK nuclease family protein [Kiritimatiellia bacterium]
MHQKLHYIGWTPSLANTVGEYLLPAGSPMPFSLHDTIVVVPTTQAGRRLRLALAHRADQSGSGVLMGPVVTPFRLLTLGKPEQKTVAPFEATAIWLDVLTAVRIRQLKALFPRLPDELDFAWRRKSVRLLMQLRNQLAEAGLTAADVAKSEHIHASERQRWQDITALESIVTAHFMERGLIEPVEQQLAAAGSANPPEGIRRVVLASCPELAPLLRQLLGRWSQTISVEVLIHAPDTMAAAFDMWGCPSLSYWTTEANIDLEHDRVRYQVVDTPREQARAVRSAVVAHPDLAASGQFAVGVPDETVTAFVVRMLEDIGCPCYDPAGVTHRQHPIIRLVKAWRDLADLRTYASLRAFVRIAAVLHYFKRVESIDDRQLLIELDKAQNDCLPSTFDHVATYVAKNRKNFPSLSACLSWLSKALARNDVLSPAYLLEQLAGFYQHNTLVPGRPEDDIFIEVARELVDACELIRKLGATHTGLTDADWIDLLLEASESRSFYRDTRQDALELEGWLELTWNHSPLLIVTGMNEGSVPDSGFDDLFLPDSVREKLGVRCDASRFARDSYLLCALTESRREHGHLVLIAGRQSDQGDVLKPSRLFWRCPDDVMVERARRFFTVAEQVTIVPERTFSIQLNTQPPDESAKVRLNRKAWNVTDFSAYLKCPFRFYLQRVLQMEEMNDAKEEMDARDFGSFAHDALEAFGRDEAARMLRDAGKVGDILESHVRDRVRRVYGPNPPLVVELQEQSVIQRLKVFAALHVAGVEEGWQIVDVEKRFVITLGDIEVRGIIDRIDRHADGRYRVLDYKTSDNANKTPDAMHLVAPRAIDTRPYVEVFYKGKNRKAESLRHWSDLQLPLYTHYIMETMGRGQVVETGYVQLTKAVSDIKISLWEGLDDRLVESAVTCAKGVLQDATAGVFGPPLITSVRDTFDERWWPDFLAQVKPPVLEAAP